MKRLRLANLRDVDLVAQPVENLRAVRLRIDRVQLHPLDVAFALLSLSDRMEIAACSLPNPREGRERAEVVQRDGIDVVALGVDVRGCAHGST